MDEDEDTLADLLTSGVDGLQPALLKKMGPAWRHRPRSRVAYDFDDEDLVAAAKAALLLAQPLILAGEPGVGKSSFAGALADRLEVPFLPVVSIKSVTDGKEMFYHFDEVGRFRDAARPENTGKSLKDYIHFSSLGRAILLSLGRGATVEVGGVPPEEIAGPAAAGRETFTLGELFPRAFRDDDDERPLASPCRSIVLIDELDKAPADTPNDILDEVENMRFRIAELDVTVTADPQVWPVVIITSNSERSFPDAFLRRCVFHWINYLEGDRLRRIAAAQIAGGDELRPDDELLRSAAEIFEKLREAPLNKPPSTAEFISFVAALRGADYQPDDRVDASHAEVAQMLGILLKNRVDMDEAKTHLNIPERSGS